MESFRKKYHRVEKLALWISVLVAVIPTGFSSAWAFDPAMNKSVAACAAPEDGLPIPLIGWAKLMQKTMRRHPDTPVSTIPKPSLLIPSAEAESPSEEEEIVETKTDSRTPSEKYALPAEILRKLGRAARSEARACRRPRGGRKICGGLSTSKGLCYQGVKDTLVRMGWASSRWSDAYAVNAHRRGYLAKHGFKNIISERVTSQQAPLGAVLVYSGGPKSYGHIEIRTGKYQYCSDFCQAAPIDDLLKRKLVGIYVRE